MPLQGHVGVTDYFDSMSGRTAEKFSMTGLSVVKSDPFGVSYINEFPYVGGGFSSVKRTQPISRDIHCKGKTR